MRSRLRSRGWLGRTEGHSWSADRALSFRSRHPTTRRAKLTARIAHVHIWPCWFLAWYYYCTHGITMLRAIIMRTQSALRIVRANAIAYPFVTGNRQSTIKAVTCHLSSVKNFVLCDCASNYRRCIKNDYHPARLKNYIKMHANKNKRHTWIDYVEIDDGNTKM